MRGLIVICLALLIAVPANSAEKRIRFDDGICDYTARFDPAKWSETAVRSALSLGFVADIATPPFAGNLSTPASVASHDPAAYAERCRAALAELDGMQTLNLPELAAYKAKRREDIVDVCAFEPLKHRAAKGEPSVLRSFTAAQSCNRFVDALEGKTDLVQVWRQAVAENCRQNASPGKCRARADAEKASPDGRDLVRLYVLDFSWNNCAVNFLKTNDGKADALRTTAQSMLKRVFKVRVLPCQP